MIRKILPLLLLVAAIFTITSCKKSSSTTTTPSGTGKPFYCKLDGTAFEPAGGGRYYVLADRVKIVGDAPATTTLEIATPNSNVGTYLLNNSGVTNVASVYYNSGGREYISTSGEVRITKSDGTKISGTFHFTATGPAGTVNVTAGEFNDIPKM